MPLMYILFTMIHDFPGPCTNQTHIIKCKDIYYETSAAESNAFCADVWGRGDGGRWGDQKDKISVSQNLTVK